MPTSRNVLADSFIQYSGANGAEVAAYMNATILSDTGTVLTVSYNPPEVSHVLHAGDWFSMHVGYWTEQQFADSYVALASLQTGNDGVGTSNGVSVAVPLLLLGGSVDRVVAWDTPFPDTSYKVRFLPDANTLGRITPVVKAGTKTVNGLTVTISAGLAVTVAGVLHVLAST